MIGIMCLVSFGSAEEVEIYRSREPIQSLEIDLLKVHLRISWVDGHQLGMRLVGDGAREFRHKVRYHKGSGVLSVGEELALGERASDLWENREVIKESPATNLTMYLEIPKTFRHVPYRFKVLMGDITLEGRGVELLQSLFLETLQGDIVVDRVRGRKVFAKSAHGALRLEQVAFDFVDLQTIYGDISLLWMTGGRIFLRAGQLAGGATINGKRERLPKQLASVGSWGGASGQRLSEVEIRTGYGKIIIDV
ncbi:DUF4097 family beta strand repeat-containing protein [Entomospira culicis]|uniref:DUF4097 domain-containing protein n=1 Tax=Entomospira culicis TaxID=2719989 RepID=A0A968GIW6_9SPIO|nr:DUF4097 domain-containing protein [Entomospira culicis]